jgi:hypothetical protein
MPTMSWMWRISQGQPFGKRKALAEYAQFTLEFLKTQKDKLLLCLCDSQNATSICRQARRIVPIFETYRPSSLLSNLAG